MTQLQELTDSFHITLNGINAEVYETNTGVLISNNDFTDPDLEYDEMFMPYEHFKTELIKNDGRFRVNRR